MLFCMFLGYILAGLMKINCLNVMHKSPGDLGYKVLG